MQGQQTTHQIMMVRPAHFGFNEETAVNNAFQTRDNSLAAAAIAQQAQAEFDGFVALLRQQGVEVFVMEDSPTPVKPDAVFPNNWLSCHADGTLVLYPMYAPIRRLERDAAIIEQLQTLFKIKKTVHFETFEAENRFLEGTGSMIFDRTHRVCYACLSPRTDLWLLRDFCDQMGFKMCAFNAVDAKGQAIYHTNVMMAIGETFAVICLDSIADEKEKEMVVTALMAAKKEIITISLAQMNRFAGNMLQVRNTEGRTFLVMSQQAYESLSVAQVAQMQQHTTVLPVNIKTIETYGGGSARCMLAEIFFDKKMR